VPAVHIVLAVAYSATTKKIRCIACGAKRIIHFFKFCPVQKSPPPRYLIKDSSNRNIFQIIVNTLVQFYYSKISHHFEISYIILKYNADHCLTQI